MRRDSRGFLARNRVRIASSAVVAVAAASLVAYAMSAQGYAVHHATLNDGGIWVTKASSGQFGRLNKPINQLDGSVFSAGGQQANYDIDVLQDGAAVVAQDRGKGELYPIDVAGLKVSSDSAIQLPADAAVAMGGGVLAVVDRAKGALRAMTFDPDQPLASIAALESAKPLAVVGAQAALAVSRGGTIFAASPDRGLTTVAARGGSFAKPRVRSLGRIDGALSVTAAGDQAVVLETREGASSGTAILPNGASVTVPTGGAGVLQQPGPVSAAVLVAGASALVSVPLSGGRPSTLFTGGTGQPPAAPVQLRGCLFAAWPGGPGVYASSCAGAKVRSAAIPGPSSKLAFRVNHDQLLLNDTDNGATWNVDSGDPQQVANWPQLATPPKQQPNKPRNTENNTNQTRALPPKPQDDELGARPGRTTPLYVLDNDSDPSGEVLAVDSVTASGPAAKWLSVAPDGQTVDIALPAGVTADTTFKYVVRAARGGTASADVTVHARSANQNADPTLRKGVKARTWSVPESGTITIPVLADWRDYTDGDPVVLAAAKAGAGQVSTTPDGSLVYVAPAKPGAQTITYTVADGSGGHAQGSLSVDVQPADGKAVAAEAQPDFARGEVGRPITVLPLANDLPGSDPLHPTASLVLAGKVASPAGTSVVTDLVSGTIVVTAQHAGTYTLGYQAGYGNAPFGKGSIRIDVAPVGKAAPPVTAPDMAVLHGQSPVTVDVLANDADPSGGLLDVQRAVPEQPSQLKVAVVGGRFVRVVARTAHLTPTTQTVAYTVSDGITGSVQGEITVSQLPAPADDTPVALADYATVRAGDAVAIPVLDNDSTPAGDPLSLVRNAPTAPGPGRYTVTPNVGAAYVSGNLVRYVAPATIRRTTDVTIDYLVQNEAGDQQQIGHAQVTITPPVSAANPDQPPTPQDIEVRSIAGDTTAIKIPTTGVDPDGDPVVVTGIGSAPKLGRVTGFTASSVVYQAFPSAANGGTDTFQYTVTDPTGLTAEGTIRVAVVAPGDPQPPVAVDDTVTVAPNATVRVDVLANDFVAAGDRVRIADPATTNPGLGKTARLAPGGRQIEVKAGPDGKHPVQLVYLIDDGLHSDRATLTVRARDGVNLPPLAFDQYATAKPGSATVSVDLLRGDYDPDGTATPTVTSPAGSIGGRLTVRLTARPQVIPYVITDQLGATAMAVVYVPAIGAGVPYAKPGKQLAVAYNGSTTFDIRDYVVDPAGKPLRTTTSDTITAAPADGLTAKAGKSATQIVLTAGKNYAGPAAVTFEVTDGRTLTERGAAQAYVTVPVQVGDVTPVLRCPATVTDIIEGGPSQTIPVAQICHVWTPRPEDAARLSFQAAWARQPAGVSLRGSGTPTLLVRADGSSHPGDSGVINIAVPHSNAPKQSLAVRVIKAPRLTIDPPVVLEMKAGETKTIDIAGHINSPFGAQASISVVGRPTKTSGDPASIAAHGASVSVTPGQHSHGTVTFSYVVTDVRDTARSDRQVTGDITVHVIGLPDAPTNVAASRTVKSNEVDLTWSAPAGNGAPIDHYTVKYAGGSQTCSAAPACAIRSSNLHNGHVYSFTVVAHNAVGDGPASAAATATPDAVPSAVPNLVASNPQNQTLTLSWTPPSGDFSPVLYYQLSWQGGSKRVTGAAARSTTISGLDNDKAYDFTIIAWNKKGPSPETHNSSAVKQSAGQPSTPPAPTVTVADDTASDNRVVNLSWGSPAVDPQGPTPLSYTVVRTPAWTGANGCTEIPATTCRDTSVKLDGTVYTYAVKVHNNAGADAPHTSAIGPATRMEAAATPDPISISSLTATGSDGQATLKFDAPKSHGKTSTVSCSMNPGGSCGTWPFPPSGQAGVVETLNGLTNGTATSVTLQECNGSSGTDFSGTSCVTSAPASVTTYGPIRNLVISTSVSGQNVNWSVSVDPNGRSANVHISNNHGWAHDYPTGTVGWSTNGSDAVGYSTNDTISVTVSDSGRASVSGSDGKTTGPPPVTITTWDGGLGTKQPGSCSGTCHTLNFQVHNFATGRFSWQCFNDSGMYYNSASYGYTISITNANQSFAGTSQSWCENTNGNTWIRINGVDSDHVYLGSG